MRKQIDLYFSFFNNSRFLISFDIARSIALFLILFMHVESGFNSYSGNKFNYFLEIGSYGIPIFFFISGFLIFKSLNKKPIIKFSKFWFRRLSRLIPLYYSMLTIYIVCILSFSKILNNFQDINFSKIITSLFFGFGKMELTYLSASWSLWYEFVFYSFTSLLLIKKNLFIKRLNIVSLIIFFSSLFLYATGSVYFYFSSGAFLYLTLTTKRFRILPLHLMVLLAISIFSKKDDINSLILYAIFIIIPFFEKFFSKANPIFKEIINFLSKISYSTYLTQIFTIPIFFKINSLIWKVNLVYWKSLLNCIFFTIIISFFVWSYLEKPLKKLFSTT